MCIIDGGRVGYKEVSREEGREFSEATSDVRELETRIRKGEYYFGEFILHLL